MDNFIAQNPEIVVLLIKTLVGLVGMLVTAIIGLTVFVFTKIDKSVAKLTEAFTMLDKNVSNLWTEHQLRKEICDIHLTGGAQKGDQT